MSATKRENLSSGLAKSVLFHFRNFSAQQVALFRVERSKSNYPKAKSELLIFDGNGIAVIKGREFGGGQTSLWT